MAELNMSAATYGRDSVTTKSLVNDLKNDIAHSRKALTGSDYQRVITSVRQYWSGADADKFVNEFKKTVSYIDEQYKKFEGFLDTVFTADMNQFKKMQNVNADQISGKNVKY